MKICKLPFLTFFLIFLTSLIYAQNATLSGFVKDNKNQPLPGALLIQDLKAKPVKTDAGGSFRIDVTPGTHTFKIAHDGFFMSEINVSLKPGELLTMDIRLNKDTTIVLNPVVIEDLKLSPFVKTSVIRAKLETSSQRDLGEQLRSIPNVSVVKKGGVSLDPVVRGFKYGQVGVQLDNGIRIEGGCPNRMDPVTAHVETEEVEKVILIKGPYMLRFGPAFGAKINLLTYKPQLFLKPEIHVRLNAGYESNWNGVREHLSIYGGNSKTAFQLSGGYKNYCNYKDGNGDIVSSSFVKYDYTGKLAWFPKKNQSLLFTFSENHGRSVRYPALMMDELSDDTRILALDYSLKDFASGWKTLNAKIYRTSVDHQMDNSHRPKWTTMQSYAQVDAINTGGRIEAGYTVKKHDFLFGGDFDNVYKDGQREMTMIMTMPGMPTTYSTNYSNLWLNAEINNGGLFTEYHTMLGKISLVASVRGDFNQAKSSDTLKLIKDEVYYFDDPSSHYINMSGSIGLSRDLGKGVGISFSLGRGVRSPNMTERFIKYIMVGYDTYDYLGNPQLKPETNYQTDLTLRFVNNKYGQFYINGFYAYIYNCILSQKIPSTVALPKTAGALGVKQFYNEDYVIYYGGEAAWISPESYPWGTDLTMAITRAFNPLAKKYIVSGSQVTGETWVSNDPLPEIPPMEGTISFYYKFIKNTLIPKVSWRLVADQRYVAEAFYETETPGFGLLNASLTYKYNKFGTLSVGCNNLFDRAYYEHLNRKISGSSVKLMEPGRIFFVNLLIHL